MMIIIVVIKKSLGFSDPVTAQYVGFVLHVITGMAAGNVFGQVSLFWSKLVFHYHRWIICVSFDIWGVGWFYFW